ncbi:MAG: type VI secretion system baseplate subunit TssE, partial [Acidiferrobacterales bacterium]|nr:type VI secretion system baseplate subunit TssE [Acidiferrobacterales bacterium]
MQSLFDRISDPGCTDFAKQKDIRASEIESIERELNCLLNTRSYIGGKCANTKRTILDYGIDNIVSAGSTVASKLENVIVNVRQAIEHYEPRLNGVQVTGEYRNNNPTQVTLQVSGRLSRTQEPVQYKI